jgi:predicted enzyme related to lactoylglutathione lyase
MPSAAISLRAVVFDCPDPSALATFYADLLNGQLDVSDPEWCEVHARNPPFKLAFQLATPYDPPVWPDGAPQQMHLDLTVSDLGAASLRAVELGAAVLTGPVEEPGCIWIVHADPAGHPFCLCEQR